MDYEAVFNEIFLNADDKEIGCFLRNEKVPFEYCLRALERKGLRYHNKAIIAARSDCPKELYMKLLKNGGENFLCDLLKHYGENPPEELLREMFDKKVFYPLIRQWRLPDDLKEKILDMSVKFDDYGNVVHFVGNYVPMDFIREQVYVPDHMLKLYEGIAYSLRDKGSKIAYGEVMDYLKYMRTPLDDETIIEILDSDYVPEEERIIESSKFVNNCIQKIAANPSISDYAMIQLRIRSPKEIINKVNEIINACADRRNEYRKNHKGE